MFETLFKTNEVNQSPTLGVVMAVAASVFLSFMLVLTYRLTSREVVERREFMQGMALISIVAATIMQAIGDSIASGLGILGALSIIRFRTSLQSPRNMAFMFASLGAGIGCGVFGFNIAFLGTLAFCLVAATLSFRRGEDAHLLIGNLRISVPPESTTNAEIQRILKRNCARHRLYEFRFTPMRSVTSTTPVVGDEVAVAPPPFVRELNYEFTLKHGIQAFTLLNEVEALPDVMDTRLRFARGVETL